MPRLALLAPLTVALALVAPGPPVSADPVLALPLTLHAPGGALDAGRARQLEGVRSAYGPHGICFDVEVVALADDRRVLHTISDRRALRRALVDRRINAFLVDRMHDPHPSEPTRRAAARAGFAPSGLLAGAHIPAPGRTPATYAIVTGDSSRLSLAHELGHFLGAPHHADPTNIMSYGRERERFSPEQVRTFRARARRLVRARALEPATCDPDQSITRSRPSTTIMRAAIGSGPVRVIIHPRGVRRA